MVYCSMSTTLVHTYFNAYGYRFKKVHGDLETLLFDSALELRQLAIRSL